MAKRSRLVPKIVFRVAVTATAVPMLVGCTKNEPTHPPSVAAIGYGPVAARGYDPAAMDASRPVPGVAVIAFDVTPSDASTTTSTGSALVPPPPPPPPGVAYRGYQAPAKNP